MARGKRRADGSLRPAVARARARRNGTAFIDPGRQARFRAITCGGTVIWNSHDLREQLGIDADALGLWLEHVAEESRWAKLRDTGGVVRAIGLPGNHPDLTALPTHRDHRERMLARVLEAERSAA